MIHQTPTSLGVIFGQNLKAIRARKKITQKELAVNLKIAPANISRYELGAQSPKLARIEEIAKYLGVLPSDLLRAEEPAVQQLSQTFETIPLGLTVAEEWRSTLPINATQKLVFEIVVKIASQ